MCFVRNYIEKSSNKSRMIVTFPGQMTVDLIRSENNVPLSRCPVGLKDSRSFKQVDASSPVLSLPILLCRKTYKLHGCLFNAFFCLLFQLYPKENLFKQHQRQLG